MKSIPFKPKPEVNRLNNYFEVPTNKGKYVTEENGNTQFCIMVFEPDQKDIERLKEGGKLVIKTYAPGLPLLSLFTINSNEIL